MADSRCVRSDSRRVVATECPGRGEDTGGLLCVKSTGRARRAIVEDACRVRRRHGSSDMLTLTLR